MNKEVSAGAVVFRKEKGEILYLLICRLKDSAWGFPKGHIEPEESEKEAALREIAEEVDLRDLKFIVSFRIEDIYESISNREPFNGQVIEKHSIFFLCETKTQNVTIDTSEISDYKWLKANEAESLLTYDSSKQILNKADTFLWAEAKRGSSFEN